MQVKALVQDDVKHLMDLIPEGWEGVLPILNWYTFADFCFPFKFLKDNKIVGIGVAVFHEDTAWLSHIMVHAENRKQGIGAFITSYLVDFIRAKNYDSIYLIATEMGAPVYRKLGFETELEYAVFKGEKLMRKANSNLTKYEAKYKKQLLELDRQITGESRSNYLEEFLPKSLLRFKGDVLEGFYMPTLGDGLILATNPKVGLELLEYRMTTKDFAIFPSDNVHASEFLDQNNFTEMYKVKRMVLGRRVTWQPEHLYHRVGGNIG